MPQRAFDPIGGLSVLGELVRLMAPPAGLREICDQGLALTVKALAPSRALLVLRAGPDGPASVAAEWGRDCTSLLAAGEKAIAAGATAEEIDPGDGLPRYVALVLPGDTGPAGAVVLEKPAAWDPAARIFARSAARAIAAAVRAAGAIEAIRLQGELLARRNLELETLREFTASGPELPGEDELLQQGLDLVLRNLGLQAGWIFWGERSRGTLDLAASRGVSESFVREARTNGIGTCLCRDVFDTGRLREARNTTQCPRLPDLVGGTGPMTHACIPLKFERGILGVMNIAHRPGQMFSADELSFLETFGQQLCLAVDKTRTARAESRRNAEARALASLTRAIGGSLDRQRVLAAVGEYGRELLRAARCAIFLGDNPDALHFAFLSGPAMEGTEVGRPFDLAAAGSSALRTSLAGRQTMVIEDAAGDPRANTELARRWGVGSAIIVPLLARGRLEGVLLATRPGPSTWSGDEIELAGTLAEHASLAIENARLYREAQQALQSVRQAQLKMMRAERLATVGTLASSLAHEVRNPLNSINLQLTLLSRRVARAAGAAGDGLGDLVETARREIARLDSLVNEFLSLARLDHLSMAPAHPAEVAREVTGLMSQLAQEQGVEMKEEFPERLPAVPLDREKIKQVLINLVRNAIEAMPRGGTVTVSGRMEKGDVVLRVADTGDGVDPALDIFGCFTTTKPEGTGLGLPIARGIVEAHGGTLTCESGRRRGTVFAMTLKVLGQQAGDAGAGGGP